ncbi:MAG: helix-turn-helix transcriptional regulator [Lachnospiraceae bacterium]|nr:helix-turn-helix transcriptional regulator [Lachnospiraceae bacterium]
MYKWNEMVQKTIDLIEEHIEEDLSLANLAEKIGYSPWYLSVKFREIVGMTLRSYIAGRRLARAADEVRNTDDRLLDIALKYSWSSQESMTKAFTATLGCTPAEYRKNPCLIPLPILKVVYFPEHYRMLHKGGYEMSNNQMFPMIRSEFIPAHKYIGIWDGRSTGYGDFFINHDCDYVCGMINSLAEKSHPVITSHTAGWYFEDGKRLYFYGSGVETSYNGEIPEGFEVKNVPESLYLVFYHPPFDYLKDNDKVVGSVEQMAWSFDIDSYKSGKYKWNDACPCYQRHYPEGLGYQVLRPIIEK